MVDEVSFKITRDDGQVFIIDDTVWRIPNDGLDGWHSHDVSIGTIDNVTSDGGVITNQRVDMRYRTITAELRDKKANAYARAQAESFFIPKHSYTVNATYMGRTRKCSGVQSAFTLSEGNIHQPITLVWTVLCPDPYMSDVAPIKSDVVQKQTIGSGMPYSVLANIEGRYNKGFVTGGYSKEMGTLNGVVYNYEWPAFIYNTGIMDVYPKLRLTINSNLGSDSINVVIKKMMRVETDTKIRWVRGFGTVRINNIMIGTSAPRELEIYIDFGKRPFKVQHSDADGPGMSFRLPELEASEDNMFGTQFVGTGVSLFAISVEDTANNNEPIGRGDFTAEMSIDAKYTGI